MSHKRTYSGVGVSILGSYRFYPRISFSSVLPDREIKAL